MTITSNATTAQVKAAKLADQAIQNQERLAVKVDARDRKIQQRGGDKALAADGPNPVGFRYDTKTRFMLDDILTDIGKEEKAIDEALRHIPNVAEDKVKYFNVQKRRLESRLTELKKLREKYRP